MSNHAAPTQVAERELVSVTGERIRVPDPQHLVHLQFRRFAGCPISNLHLRSMVRRHDEITAAGIREVVFFHSPADELRPHTADLPFATIADPEKRYYREFGVESGLRALDPRAWGAAARGIAMTITGQLRAPRPDRKVATLGYRPTFSSTPTDCSQVRQARR